MMDDDEFEDLITSCDVVTLQMKFDSQSLEYRRVRQDYRLLHTANLQLGQEQVKLQKLINTKNRHIKVLSRDVIKLSQVLIDYDLEFQIARADHEDFKVIHQQVLDSSKAAGEKAAERYAQFERNLGALEEMSKVIADSEREQVGLRQEIELSNRKLEELKAACKILGSENMICKGDLKSMGLEKKNWLVEVSKLKTRISSLEGQLQQKIKRDIPEITEQQIHLRETILLHETNIENLRVDIRRQRNLLKDLQDKLMSTQISKQELLAEKETSLLRLQKSENKLNEIRLSAEDLENALVQKDRALRQAMIRLESLLKLPQSRGNQGKHLNSAELKRDIGIYFEGVTKNLKETQGLSSSDIRNIFQHERDLIMSSVQKAQFPFK